MNASDLADALYTLAAHTRAMAEDARKNQRMRRYNALLRTARAIERAGATARLNEPSFYDNANTGAE